MSFTCSQCSQKKKVEVNTFEDDVCLSCDCDIKHYTMAEFIAEFKLPTELNEDQKIIIDEITDLKDKIINYLKQEIEKIEAAYKECVKRNTNIVLVSTAIVKEYPTFEAKPPTTSLPNIKVPKIAKKFIKSLVAVKLQNSESSGNTIKEVQKVPLFDNEPTSLLSLSDGRIALGTFQGNVLIVDPQDNFKKAMTMYISNSQVKHMCVLDNSSLVIPVDRALKVYNLREYNYQCIFEIPNAMPGEIISIVALSDNQVATLSGALIRIWNFDDLSKPYANKPVMEYGELKEGQVLAYDNYKKILYAAGYSKSIMRYSMKNYQVMEPLTLDNKTVIHNMYVGEDNMLILLTGNPLQEIVKIDTTKNMVIQNEKNDILDSIILYDKYIIGVEGCRLLVYEQKTLQKLQEFEYDVSVFALFENGRKLITANRSELTIFKE